MASRDFALRGVKLWPTMLFMRYWEEHTHESPAIISLLYELRDAQASQIDSGIAVGAKSSTGLYESQFDLFKQAHAGLKKLQTFIQSTLALAVSIANDNEFTADQLVIELADSWYHITNQGGFHDAHVHNDCSWCGIYYLRLAEAGKRTGDGAPNGGSRFYCPFLQGGTYRDCGNQYIASSIDPPISDGMLLIFPAFLWHSGLPYFGVDDRIVVAFNARAFRKQ